MHAVLLYYVYVHDNWSQLHTNNVKTEWAHLSMIGRLMVPFVMYFQKIAVLDLFPGIPTFDFLNTLGVLKACGPDEIGEKQ